MIFHYAFMIRAIIAGSLVSLCSALLGVCLVLKRYSMIGDGLSHVGFGSLAIAMALNLAPLAVSIPVCIIAAFFLLRLSGDTSIKGDAAIALLSSSALAIGILVTSLTSGLNTDVTSYMFGSILSMSKTDVGIAIALAAVVIVLFFVFYRQIFSVTFDETFAKASGLNVQFYNTLIALLTALTVVIGMRLMGAMMISSLIIFPALTSMRIFKSFKAVIISSAIVSLFCFFAGIVISFYCASPAGATIVVVNLLTFLVFSLISYIKSLKI